MSEEEDNPPTKTNAMNTIESIHTLKITTLLTGSENYPLWKRQMELALSAKRRLGYVNGKTPKPKEDEEKIEAWTVANNQKRYTVANGARKFKLNRESYEATQNERSIEDYYTQLQMIWDELDNMSTLVTTLPSITKVTTNIAEYLKAVEAQAEERKLFQFLNGLDKDYGVLRSNILMMDPLPSVEHTVSLMLQEEMQANNLGNTNLQESLALLSKREFEREKCVHCGRDNHKSELCWEIKGYPVGHPKQRKINYKPGFRCGGFRQQRTFQTNPRQQNFKRTAANVRADQPDLSAAIGMTNYNSQTHDNWIIDSGATNHMSSKLDVINNVKELQTKLRISLPDGRYVLVTHKGEVDLNRDLQLTDVLYVPSFKHNLMSVQKLIKENQCYVTFFDTHFYVQGCTKGEIKGIGSTVNGGNFSLWHNRLGHAPLSKIKHLTCLNLQKCNAELCLTCPMAKLTKQPFAQSQTTVDNPFDLIHIDIWGPYRVVYRGKFRYFLTIVDEKSRGTWVTQFGKKIKIIRSDNALEFDDCQCRKLFETKGMIHQTSIVDRPQQNGVVERKHRHLLEISRALRFHSGLPLSYWGDCVMTAAYLINRIPSSVIKNKTPYEVIHKKSAKYEELKVFGCLAMVYNPDRSKDKFQPRSVRCLFLGYPAHQNGYKV
ncbi:hypothetical protein RND81_12G148200 [Saponaria officinalis]|uniref:Integrase catalytic domain-containing protein n=1 Tax=Saponaria officinalis TaxID=3572 RepID=A0AAW1HAL6_SAPOF